MLQNSVISGNAGGVADPDNTTLFKDGDVDLVVQGLFNKIADVTLST